MRELWLVLATVISLQGAVIRGTVVENRSGNPLSRAAVVLQPVAGTPGNVMNARTDRFGGFTFAGLPAGSYVVTANRTGFVPAEYGQRRWNAAGLPIMLDDAGSTFLNLRLMRWGGLTGTVRDENGIGRQDFEVHAYRDGQPPQRVASAKTDDRGIYRIGGLEPGTYMVRTAPREEDNAGYLPTFAPEASRVEEARQYHVLLDEDTREADVRPLSGRLHNLTVSVAVSPEVMPIYITLSSDMGRQMAGGPVYQFRGLPPGPYEVLAERPANPEFMAKYQAVYAPVSIIDKDTSIELVARDVVSTRITVIPEAAGKPDLLAMRTDLAGDGTPFKPQIQPGGYTPLAPGRWKFLLDPPPGYYVSDVSGLDRRFPRPRVDGWNEITLRGGGSVSFSLSKPAGTLRGVVKFSGDTVPGAPVFVEGYDAESRKRVGPLRSTRTDARGNYRFDGLAPGNYRVVATFEYRAPDSTDMEQAGAVSVLLERSSEREKDLELYGNR